jgi:excisionase family DNA binding protein
MTEESDVLDVRDAAAAVGRHPETIRRWVWSGQLRARREGRRLLVRRADLEAVAGTVPVERDLAAWARSVRLARGEWAGGTRATASNLVFEDRSQRSNGDHDASR